MRLAALRTGPLRMVLAAGLLKAFGFWLLRAFRVFFADLRAVFLLLLFVLRFAFFLRVLRLRCRRRRLLALFLAVLFLARLALRLRRLGDEAFLFSPPARRTKAFGDFFAMLPSRQARPIARMTSVLELCDTFFVRTK